MIRKEEVCAVVVAFDPDEHVFGNLDAMRGECGRVIVVDNGASTEFRERIASMPGVERIDMGGNRGVAAALNAGAARAGELGFRSIVTFDQDSRPRNGMVEALLSTLSRHPSVRIVVPLILEPGQAGENYRWVRAHPRWPGCYQRVRCEKADLVGITLAITSGSLIDLETWTKLGGFDEALFIDYVDIDYCLKVLRAGGEIAVSAGAKLEHRLGARQSRVVLGHDVRPTYHAPFRHYFMARNRLRVWRRHAFAVPHWAAFDLTYALYNVFRVMAFEPSKGAKLKAIALGMWDGLLGRSGPCPDVRWRMLREQRS